MKHRLCTNHLLSALWLVTSVTCRAETTAQAQPVILIQLYSDFQCPYCAQLAQPVRELESKGVPGVRTKIEFKHFPLSFHAQAQLAHQAAVAAGEQGKFWDMHDLLFWSQRALQREALLGYARELSLDIDRFVKDLDGDKVKRAVESDKAEGEKRGVQGTPTYFINGQEYSGAKTYDQLAKLVQEEARRAQVVSEITDSLISRGPQSAPVILEFYADLLSPVSRAASYVIDELLARYPNTIRLQFRNFPLAFHPQSGLAHDAAMAAAKHGRFWEVATYAFDHQDSLREQELVAYASQLGLKADAFAESLKDRRYGPKIDSDLKAGFKRGVRGSPVIFVNDKRIDGVPSLRALAEHVEAELAAKPAEQ